MHRALKQELCVRLELHQTKESQFGQVFFGTLQHDAVTLCGVDAGGVVAVDKGEVGHHACLAVEGQVVGAIHEVFQTDTLQT